MQPVVIGDVIWTPSAEVVRRSRLRRFMDERGVASYPELVRRSAADPQWFWAAALADLDIEFYQPFERILDQSEGPPWVRWFPGGKLNIVHNCLDRRLDGPEADRLALTWEGEAGERRRLTYAELNTEVCRLASALRRLGAEIGDRVGLFMPMTPEAAIALIACAKIGAVAVPLFSGFGAGALAARLDDAGATILICGDGFHRRGAVVPMKEVAEVALARCPSVRHVIVHRHLGREIPWKHGRDLVWEQLLEEQPDRLPTEHLDSEAPLMVIHTSGTSGRPKGTVHLHSGFPIKAAQDLAHGFDMGADDTIFWFTDLGWMMGPWLIYGSLLLGATMALYEGAPDHPAPDRLWRLVADHGVTILGVSPTLVRSLMQHGPDPTRGHDLSSLRILGGTGEPWNPAPFMWFFDNVGGGRLPIINYSGGTEVSGGILCGNVLSPLRPCSFAGPVPGMAADVADESGRGVRGEVGELVVRGSWPGMTRGFWNDADRYLATYWSRFADVWVHGDWAYVDPDDGLWYILGRSDDTIKVGGKRLGPSEVESLLVGHPAVSEAAAIGIPHEVRGEVLACFVVLAPGQEASPELASELKEVVTASLGRPLRPQALHFVPDLPRTRNAKIIRRLVKAVYLGLDPGDVSALENPTSLERIAAIIT